MKLALQSIAALLLATFFLYTGNGLQGTLLSVRAGIEQFPTALIGVLMSGYYIGFILGCRFVPRMIASAGHIRTYVALASIASSSALAHAILVEPAVWVGLRAITGFCFAGMAMVIESWLNERATNETRGSILSIYRIVDLGALTIGNALLGLASPTTFVPFAIVSILVSLALVPIALTNTQAPKPVAVAKLDVKALYRVSPVGALAALATGLANAAFWSMGPIFVQQGGYGPEIIGLFMSTVIIGAAISQWPLGFLSDRVDRRYVIMGCCVATVIFALSMSAFALDSQTSLLAIGAVFGAVLLPIFGLSVAHANDLTDPAESVATNGGLLLLHGLGAVFGAFAGAGVMALFGPDALFLYIAAIYTIIFALVLIRVLQRSDTGADEKETFVPLARNAAPTVFELGEDDLATLGED
ncbi:MFS transporter [Litorimonas sp. WD9-15]|uniref:MFS transporter n=1 Tax=Litorimonas sp. WD9-15 TaxID=3418716 RepID=UPI003D03CF2A